MTARLLDGKTLAARRHELLAERVAGLAEEGIYPHLAVIVPTQDDAALAYFQAKRRLGERLGISVQELVLDRPSTADLTSAVEALASDRSVSGILIEAPWPADIDTEAVRACLPCAKDVDGAGTAAMGRLYAGAPAFPPATAAAVLALLDGSHVPLEGAHVVVIGRSLVVGRPLSLLLLERNATVTICHSRTRHLAALWPGAPISSVSLLGARASSPPRWSVRSRWSSMSERTSSTEGSSATSISIASRTS